MTGARVTPLAEQSVRRAPLSRDRRDSRTFHANRWKPSGFGAKAILSARDRKKRYGDHPSSTPSLMHGANKIFVRLMYASRCAIHVDFPRSAPSHLDTKRDQVRQPFCTSYSLSHRAFTGSRQPGRLEDSGPCASFCALWLCSCAGAGIVGRRSGDAARRSPECIRSSEENEENQAWPLKKK